LFQRLEAEAHRDVMHVSCQKWREGFWRKADFLLPSINVRFEA
jgi:hypothetical protein